MALFLLRFWPVFVPLLGYWLWLAVVRRRARKAGRPLPRFRDGPWYWAVLGGLATGVFCLLFLAAGAGGQKGEYIPAHMENGTLVPGTVRP